MQNNTAIWLTAIFIVQEANNNNTIWVVDANHAVRAMEYNQNLINMSNSLGIKFGPVWRQSFNKTYQSFDLADVQFVA